METGYIQTKRNGQLAEWRGSKACATETEEKWPKLTGNKTLRH